MDSRCDRSEDRQSGQNRDRVFPGDGRNADEYTGSLRLLVLEELSVDSVRSLIMNISEWSASGRSFSTETLRHDKSEGRCTLPPHRRSGISRNTHRISSVSQRAMGQGYPRN